jgi:hypothetical protein
MRHALYGKYFFAQKKQMNNEFYEKLIRILTRKIVEVRAATAGIGGIGPSLDFGIP